MGFRKKWDSFLEECRNSRVLVLIIVFIALLLDRMLITVVVPILPDYIYKLNHPRLPYYVNGNSTLPADPTLSATATNQTDPPPPQHLTTTTQRTTQDSQRPTENPEYWQPTEYWAPTGISYPSSQTTQKSPTKNPQDTYHEVPTNQDLVDENLPVGILFASKATIQLIVNPFVGPMTNRVGYGIPMFIGFAITLVSTVVFAFGESYAVLFIARSIQGIGSACSSVAGMAVVADRYPDDAERGRAMGIALSGIALGCIGGPLFGGIMYQFFDKSVPFLILAGIALLEGCLQLLVLRPGAKKEILMEGAPLGVLLRDPYIVIAAGSICFANMAIALLEPTLPIWMMDTLDAPSWQIGSIWLPSSIAYLVGAYMFGFIATKLGRWLCGLLAMIFVGASMIWMPCARSFHGLIPPNAVLGLAIGVVDSSLMPIMGYLVDRRHVSVYGSVYAIADVANCVGFAIGPAVGGEVVVKYGFGWLMWGIGIINILYSPLCIFLREPPGKEEKEAILAQDECQVTYNAFHQQPDAEKQPEDYEEDEMMKKQKLTIE
ncbi:PREDICTED: synaptic vesicular amine transporter-like isoform X1 [Branchiostoma belcheri]|uniref:Synaptic vesicular amine transporter-like isoform X1 n=2 Tax=Branchiostoma belcheri TaxID=7741 RepID=A0A6P4YIM0_BRABE|nr:PREDICTED: synaptic vesicular amine transporter-like isoform X1 [Branchiostoma belcheri]